MVFVALGGSECRWMIGMKVERSFLLSRTGRSRERLEDWRTAGGRSSTPHTLPATSTCTCYLEDKLL